MIADIEQKGTTVLWPTALIAELERAECHTYDAGNMVCSAILCLKSCFFGFRVDAVGDFAFLQNTPVCVCTWIIP